MSNFLRKNNAEKDIETSLAERELNEIKVLLFLLPPFSYNSIPNTCIVNLLLR
jgi:hypothetical protein